ncbi:MAG: response regulator transcription factor [Saprospiraceae bacterium]
MIRVLIVDDHKILAQALVDYLNSKEHIECIGMVHSGQEAIEQVPRLQPDIILMDIGMPGMDGIECCKRLMEIDDQLNIVGLSTHIEISVAKSLFRAGAVGYVSKTADINEVVTAIEWVHQGKRYIGEVIREEYLSELSNDKPRKVSSYSYIPQLTGREMEVLQLIAEELTTEEIGQRLFISSNTVQTHRKNLISKFGVRNSVGLILKALELKMI